MKLARVDKNNANIVNTHKKPKTRYLEDVFTRSDISDVNPLAVNIVTVGVPAANCDALLPHVVAGIALVQTFIVN